jgi:hypothetical protein
LTSLLKKIADNLAQGRGRAGGKHRWSQHNVRVPMRVVDLRDGFAENGRITNNSSDIEHCSSGSAQEMDWSQPECSTGRRSVRHISSNTLAAVREVRFHRRQRPKGGETP